MYCIREKGTNKLLGVSFTEDGLKFIANKDAKILLFRNAKFDREGDKVVLKGDLRPNPDVYIAEYKKIDHLDRTMRFNNSASAYKYQTRASALNRMENFWEKAIDLKTNYPKYYHLKSSRELMVR